MRHIYNSKQIQLIYKGHKIISKIKTSIVDLIATAESKVSDTIRVNIVDVNYQYGYYNDTGRIQSFTNWYSSLYYKQVIGGTNVIVTSPNIDVKNIKLAQYDSDYNFISTLTDTVSSNSCQLTLGENTVYVRPSFQVWSDQKRFPQLFYEYTIETVTNE